MYSGSRQEKLNVPHYRRRQPDTFHGKPYTTEYMSPDIDVMYVVQRPLVAEVDDVTRESHPALCLDQFCSPDGFTRVRIRSGWPTREDPRWEFWQYGVVALDSDTWLSGSRMIESLGHFGISRGLLHRHGPALTGVKKSEQGEDWTVYLEEDVVLALQCPQWLSQAREWLIWSRKSLWITDVIKREIRRLGCHLVPIGHYMTSLINLELEFYGEYHFRLPRNISVVF